MADKESQGPAKRPRAPTITIDTSAVSSDPDMGYGGFADGVSDSKPLSQTDAQSVNAPSDHSPKEFRPNNSLDYPRRDSRPTSPHNVLSPAKLVNDQKSFLSVPHSRPRANSSDSEASSAVSSASGTYIGSPSVPAEHGTDLDTHDALEPDPGTEADFHVENNPFGFSPGQLSKLINPKSLAAFHVLGGLAGIEKGLRSDRKTGLSVDESHLDGRVTFEQATSATETSPTDSITTRVEPDASDSPQAHHAPQHENAFADRKRVFSDNRLPERKSKNILQLAWIAFNDKVLILLSIAAVISLALGLYQTFGQTHEDGGARVEWVEGVAIMVAVLIVVVVGAVNDWKKERQFIKLNKKKDDRVVKVIRSGKTILVSVYDIFAGDIVLLEPGDLIPVDGIFIQGYNVKCDESSATGESDLLRKTPAVDAYRAIENRESLRKVDPFILSGAKVAEGFGSYMATAAGIHSGYGRTLMSLRDEPEITPLQSKLNKLAEQIAKLGGASALLLFVVLFIKFLAQLKGSNTTPAMKGQNFLQILIVAITIVVVAVPEGLPLAVTLALAFATTRMLKDNNLVRLLRSCETMGNATTICSDKTGTLTENKMTVVAGCLGTSSRFGDRKIDSNNGGNQGNNGNPSIKITNGQDDVQPPEFVKTLDDSVKTLFEQSVVVNSTAFEGEENGEATFVGSKTETALLVFAREYLGMGPVNVERSNADVAQLIPFDSGRKCMAAVVKLKDGHYRMYVKGASEILLEHSTKILRDPTRGLEVDDLTSETRHTLEHTISTYASRSLRTIALLFKDYEMWPPKGAKTMEDSSTQADFDDVLKEMVFFGVVGIQDPLRSGVKEAVQNCQMAGVYVRMVTGDNIETAKAIAEDCGILVPGGIAMEGPAFRRLSRTQMTQTIPKLCVLARSSPEDKRILVRRLKDMGETVAVTGDGTNDAPALKAADVGFSMGIAGTEVAKEASAIILMDDNFASIVKALLWGRAVNDAVRKFLQFQLTVNITAVLLTFISAVASNSESSVLNAVQLLWVNLIMDTFAALALATDPPTWSLLHRKPDPKSAPLITVRMWKMIIGQAIYQLAVTLILHFGGNTILSYQGNEQKALSTLVFNVFVWMQIFNQINNRRLDNGFNVFEGIHRNYFFMLINFIMIGGQVMIIFVGGAAFKVQRLDGYQWAISLVLGALSLPIGAIIRLIPDELLVRMVPDFIKRRSTPTVTVSDEENRFQYNPGVLEIRDELAFIKKIRGGRLGALKWRIQHPREVFGRSRSGSRLSSSHEIPHTPNNEATSEIEGTLTPQHLSTPEMRKTRRGRSNSAFGAAAAMAGVLAGSIAGLSPIERREGDDDSLKFPRNLFKSDFERQDGIDVHPRTHPEDPIIVENPLSLGLPPSQLKETTPDFPVGPLQGPPSTARSSEDKDKALEYSLKHDKNDG